MGALDEPQEVEKAVWGTTALAVPMGWRGPPRPPTGQLLGEHPLGGHPTFSRHCVGGKPFISRLLHVPVDTARFTRLTREP